VRSLVFAVNTARADTLRKESFEGCTGVGYSLLYGSFTGDENDGLQCGSQAGPRPFTFSFGSTVTGYDGTDYIGLEDLVGMGLPNPNGIRLTDVDITGYANLNISLLVAAPSPTVGRYEATDYLEVQYQVDGGSWVTLGRFFGRGGGYAGMGHDANLDNVGTTIIGSAMQRFTYALDNRAGQGIVSGSTLSVRVMFSSDGAQEEMAFDDIVVTGDLVPDSETADAGVTDAGGGDSTAWDPADASAGELTSDVALTDTSGAVTSDVTSTDTSGAVTSDDLTTDLATSEAVTSDVASTEITTEPTSTDEPTAAPGDSTSDAPNTDTSSSDSTSSSDVAPIADAGADAGQGGTPGSGESCDCRVGAKSSSSSGWFGLALAGLVLARLNRRRGGSASNQAAHKASI
jgi:MYXO-CTERM domain-containing protein